MTGLGWALVVSAAVGVSVYWVTWLPVRWFANWRIREAEARLEMLRAELAQLRTDKEECNDDC